MSDNKILITGLPHSGKSILLNKLIKSVEHKQGFITQEVLEDNQRTGYKVVTAIGTESVLASTSSESPLRVSKYGVEVDNLENIIPEIITYTEQNLLYIDEIGQMELFSHKFKQLVEKYLDSENNFIGTISQVYFDDFTKSILSGSDVKLIYITPENRDEVFNQLSELIK